MSQNPDKPDPIEYFYLEDPNIPDTYFPLKSYGIYDRITLEETKINRLKEDIIKILSESKKFGVYLAESRMQTEEITQKQVQSNF